jgi:hypothetical protein
VILPAPDPTVVKSSKERIWIRLRTTWIDSGTEQWQIPGRSTGRSHAAEPESRSVHILKSSLRHGIQQKVLDRFCKYPTALDKSVGITTMIDYRNRTIVGLPTKQRNCLRGRTKRRSLLERFDSSSLRSTQHQGISREYSFPKAGGIYWRPCCDSLSHVLLPRRHGAPPNGDFDEPCGLPR